MLLRHFKVFFNIAGEKLSVPFSQQDTQEIEERQFSTSYMKMGMEKGLKSTLQWGWELTSFF